MEKLTMPKNNRGIPIKNWEKIVVDFRISGLKQSVYCRNKKIPSSSLSTWLHRYKDKHESINTSKIRDGIVTSMTDSVNESTSLIADFAQLEFKEPPKPMNLEVTPEFAECSGIHVCFPENIKVELDTQFNESMFLKILRLLKSELC